MSGEERLEPADFLAMPLADRLRVRRVSEDEFVGAAPTGYESRVYGGHLVAQALVAAANTVSHERQILSLQAYFLRPGVPDEELRYFVHRLRDGRSFTARGVDVVQSGRTIFSCRASFLRGRDDSSQSRNTPMPDVPQPEDLPPLHVRRGATDASPDGFNWVPGEDWQSSSRPLDIRYVDGDGGEDRRRCFWFRADAGGDGQAEQRAILAFASDRSLLPTILHAKGDLRHQDHIRVASLDHAMWFHADIAAGDWWLYVQHSPFGSSRLGLASGLIYASSGELVASVVQQGVLEGPPA